MRGATWPTKKPAAPAIPRAIAESKSPEGTRRSEEDEETRRKRFDRGGRLPSPSARACSRDGRPATTLRRFEQAAAAYTNYINLLPNKDRSDKAAWSRAQVRFLKSFAEREPLAVEETNSLAGEAIGKGIAILRPYGRFVELGKRDIYDNTASSS